MLQDTLIKNVPHKPGCYLFKNEKGDVLYIGKARDLKKRVRSYFRRDQEYEKTKVLAWEIQSVDFIVTNNEVEALLLEARLVRERQPRYNILLKDDKSYPYIMVTKEEYPRLITVRTSDLKKGDTVYGPYISGASRREFLRLANSLFKLRVCRTLPRRACILYHIGQCSAPCIANIERKEYLENMKKAEMLLKGNTKELMEILENEMKKFSKNLNYELAKIRRDQIKALKYLAQKEIVHLRKRYNQDVIHYIVEGKTFYIQLFNIHKGVISNRKDYVIKTRFGDERHEIIQEFLQRYYYENDIPNEIILPHIFPEYILFQKFLEKLSGRAVRMTHPKKGDKKKLLDLLKENIISKHQLGSPVLRRLAEVLRLEAYPGTIECFDISNLGPKYIAGSLVHFQDGEPNKSQYRRFRVKTVLRPSDFDSIKEIVFRRYYRLKMENAVLPNLVVIDGGKPQLTAALCALKELGLTIPTIALAKREEEIYSMDTMYPLKLSKSDPALKLLQRIRNEAHRFAVKYHRLLRSQFLPTPKE